MNTNLINHSHGVSEGVFATREEAVEWAGRLNMVSYTLSPTDRPCWTRW